MIDLDSSHSPSESAPILPEGAGSLLQSWFAFLASFGRTVLAFRQHLVSLAEEADRQHRRAERLAAYRLRHSWKKSDIPRLKTLDVNRAARRRMERVTGRGRPVVRPHKPLVLGVARKFHDLEPLFNSRSEPQKRRRAFKLWPRYQHYVEALYRGEHALAKEQGIPGPSVEAERRVGEAMGISLATVHAICGKIRRMRKEWDDSANFPPITLIAYDKWMKTGEHPWINTE